MIQVGGTYSAFMMAIALPTPAVREMLPDSLTLVEQDVAPAGHHPLLMGFGRQERVGLAGLQWVPSMNYLEQFTAIPFVQRTGRPGSGLTTTRAYVARLYLNKLAPTLGGALVYGYNKELAAIRMEDTRYQVVSAVEKTPILALNARVVGGVGAIDEFPHFAPVQRMMEQALVAKTLWGRGPYLYSTFDWTWDAARIRPVEAELRILHPYLRGIEPMRLSTAGIDATSLGAFRLHAPWTLSRPYLHG